MDAGRTQSLATGRKAEAALCRLQRHAQHGLRCARGRNAAPDPSHFGRGAARFVHIAHHTSAAEAWMLHDLQLAPNYAAALAYHGTERPVAVSPIIDPVDLLSIPERRSLTCA